MHFSIKNKSELYFNNMKSKILTLLLTILSAMAYAQEVITVKGVVSGADNKPLQGATVTEKGARNTVVTGNDGAYQIKLKSNSTLVISYVNYTTLERAVSNRTTINITLQSSQSNLDDVVVVGYGQTVKRKDLTGSVSSVSGTELAKVPVQNVAQALQGRIAGMQVTTNSGEPGSLPRIVIRGGTSITQSNEPLYVVDGVPQVDGLNFLDPMDIESIDVLKDASATAIYGARGANGVVLVTTKRTKAGKTTINYDNYVGVQKITRFLPVLSPYDFTQYIYENAVTDATRLARFVQTYGTYDSLKLRYENRPGIDWQKEVLGNTTVSQYHKVSINGGNNEMRYNLFYSKNNNEGILLNSGANKDIIKLTVTNNFSTKGRVTAIVNYSNQYIYGSGGTQNGGNARLSFLQNLFQYRPINGKGNDLDLLDDIIDPFDNQSNPAFQSPIVAVTTRDVNQSVKDLNLNLSGSYNIVKHLTYNGLVNLTNSTNKTKSFVGATNIQALRNGGPYGGITDNLSRQLNYNNVLTYSNVFAKDHNMDVSVGQEYIYQYSEGLTARATNFPATNLGFDNLGLGTVAAFPSSNAQDSKLFSLFARANYGYKGKYLLSGSIRRDGSSVFGSENVFGYFPSGAFAWRVIQEPFMKNYPAISDLKLRVSYGTAGNNRIANYAALSTLTPDIYGLLTTVYSSVYQSNLANPFLKWETVVKKNLGVDIGLYKQRITLTAEVYDNRSKDLLYNTRIPASSGFIQQFQNIGETSARGLEFTLNTTNIKSKQFTWNTSFNIGFNKTEVIKLSDGENSLLANSFTTYSDYILQVGQPVGMMYGYIRDGLYQVDDFDYNPTTNTYTQKAGVVNNGNVVMPGYAKYKDLSGPAGKPDGLINDYDRTVIGNANPKYIGGINNNFSYKGIDLTVFCNFSVGNDIYNANIQNNLSLANEFNSNLAFQAQRWTNINSLGQLVTKPAELAALNRGKNTIASIPGTTASRTNDLVIEDGSFFRINTVSVGYSFPKNWLRTIKVTNARIYFTAYNLYVFTKYSGYDPEVSVINNPLTSGVDFSAYPRARSFVAGINLSL